MTLTNETRQIIIENNVCKAHQAVKDAEMLLKANSYTGALNRIYYGIFYIISALAIKHKFSTSNHSQLIGWFNKNFVKSFKVERNIGKIVHYAFDQRMDGDYNALSEFFYDDIADDLENMKKVMSTVEKLVRQ